MTPEQDHKPEIPKNVNLSDRTISLEISRSKLQLKWDLLPKDFQDQRYFITEGIRASGLIVWLYTQRVTPNLKASQPTEELKGIVIPDHKWQEILADAKLIPSQRNPVRRYSRLHCLAPNLITLKPTLQSDHILQYKFGIKEATGNYGYGITKRVELKFPKID